MFASRGIRHASPLPATPTCGVARRRVKLPAQFPWRMNEMARAILLLLGEGHSTDDVLRLRPDLTREDIAAAARDALRIAEGGEPRKDRIARVRRQHPNAFEPWSPLEDKMLVDAFQRGQSISAIARAFGRPPGAIRTRLQRLGHDPRRSVIKDAAPPPPPPPPRDRTFEWMGGP